MIYALILISIGAIATVIACKSINAGFAGKNELLIDRESNLYKEQDELRSRRRDLKRKLEELKNNLKKGKTQEDTGSLYSPASLRDWILNTGLLDTTQYTKAEKYAEEKNMDMASALLTLSMISVETFEKAKKLKLR